jgi:outer membrane murein-binding lipoprotein Lpp
MDDTENAIESGGGKTYDDGMGPRVDKLEQDVATIAADVGVLKSDVGVLKNDVSALKTDVSVLKTDVSVLKTDVAVLKTDVTVLKTDVAVLKTDVSHFKETYATKADLHEALHALTWKIIGAMGLMCAAVFWIARNVAPPDRPTAPVAPIVQQK